MWKRQHTLLFGLAVLLLLAVGVGVVLLWPQPPSEAEKAASVIQVGMTWEKAASALQPAPMYGPVSDKDALRGPAPVLVWIAQAPYPDGSTLILNFDELFGRVTAIRTTPPPPVHPLDRLRRTLARVLPFLGSEP